MTWFAVIRSATGEMVSEYSDDGPADQQPTVGQLATRGLARVQLAHRFDPSTEQWNLVTKRAVALVETKARAIPDLVASKAYWQLWVDLLAEVQRQNAEQPGTYPAPIVNGLTAQVATAWQPVDQALRAWARANA